MTQKPIIYQTLNVYTTLTYFTYHITLKTFEKCVQKYINLFKKREIELVGPTKYVAFSFGFIASIGSEIKR